MSRRTPVESFGPLSMHPKLIMHGVLGTNVAFEIDIFWGFTENYETVRAIKSRILVRWYPTRYLRTRANLGYAPVHILSLPTHSTKPAQSERCFSRAIRDGGKTEMEKDIRVAKTSIYHDRGNCSTVDCHDTLVCNTIWVFFDAILVRVFYKVTR